MKLSHIGDTKFTFPDFYCFLNKDPEEFGPEALAARNLPDYFGYYCCSVSSSEKDLSIFTLLVALPV